MGGGLDSWRGSGWGGYSVLYVLHARFDSFYSSLIELGLFYKQAWIQVARELLYQIYFCLDLRIHWQSSHGVIVNTFHFCSESVKDLPALHVALYIITDCCLRRIA
jgi:hypothetical protein